MKPLILEYIESANDADVYPNLEYNKRLQLSVLKGTQTPAFDVQALRTNTFTKAGDEPTDVTDYSGSSLNLYTSTQSAINNEDSDKDHDVTTPISYAGTMTMTRTNTESSDSDL
jgi:hypothetical protein